MVNEKIFFNDIGKFSELPIYKNYSSSSSIKDAKEIL